MRASYKIRKFKNSYFSNRLGVVKNSTKLYIFLDLTKILFYLKYFLENSVNDFLFI